MRSTSKIALLAVALAGGSLSAGLPATAEVAVTIAPGGYAYGYNDGYWDREHHWHAWKNHEEAMRFREENRDHYYDRNHDRDPDQGWHNDHWWDRH